MKLYSLKPRNPQQPIFNTRVLTDLVIKSLVLSAVVTAFFLYSYYNTYDLATAQTFAFSAWIIGHVVMAYISRSDTESIISIGLFTNPTMNLWALAAVAFLLTVIYVPYVNHLVRLTPLPFISFLLVVGIVIVVMLMLEFKKFLTRP